MHGGGRLIKYKNDQYLCQYLILDNLLISANKKITLWKNCNYKKNRKYDVFSLGHRNPQGLYWDIEKDIIISSEHGQ